MAKTLDEIVAWAIKIKPNDCEIVRALKYGGQQQLRQMLLEWRDESSDVKSMIECGVIDDPVSAVIGSYPGAMENPEVIAAIDKLNFHV